MIRKINELSEIFVKIDVFCFLAGALAGFFFLLSISPGVQIIYRTVNTGKTLQEIFRTQFYIHIEAYKFLFYMYRSIPLLWILPIISAIFISLLIRRFSKINNF